MADIVAISHACVTAINRVIYRELAGLGWQLELIVPHALTEGATYFREADPPEPGDPPIHYLKLLGHNQRLHLYPDLFRILERARPRVVFVDSDPGSLVTLMAGAWARGRSAHLFCQSNENLERRLSDRVRRRQYKRAVRDVGIAGLIAASRAVVDHVFVLSNDGWKVTEGLGFKGRVSKIPVGFDGRLFKRDVGLRAQTRRELGLTELTVAYFGRQLPEKGVHLLIEALAGMMGRPWQLLLDRFAENRDQYSQRLSDLLVSTGVGQRTVHFDATHREMPRFMNAADIVVMPSISNESWREQYGRVAPEAMACGRVVLASDCGTLPELVSDTGVVFPEGDVEAIRVSLAALMDDPARRATLGDASARRAAQLLSVRSQRDLMHEQLIRFARPSGAASSDTI